MKQKKIKAIVFLMLFAVMASGYNKGALATVKAATAKPVNANSAPAATSAPAAPQPEPVLTDDGEHVYTHAASGLQFQAPSSWKAEADGDMMTLTSADGMLTIILWVPEEGSLKEALNALNEEFGKIMKNIKRIGEPSRSTLNGMAVYTIVGTGEIDGVKMEYSADLIEAKKPVIALRFAAPGAFAEHKKEIVAFVRSLKKVD